MVLDVIDLLHFNTLLVNKFFPADIRGWFEAIEKKLNRILDDENLSGTKREIVKHYVLCALEISLEWNEESYENMRKRDETLNRKEDTLGKRIFDDNLKGKIHSSLSILMKIIDSKGIDNRLITNLKNKIISDNELNITSTPMAVKYRLVQRYLAFENSYWLALCFYKKSIDLGLIDASKNKYTSTKYSDGTNDVFIRACLLIEFEAVRITSHGDISKYIERDLVIKKPDYETSLDKRHNLIRIYKKRINNLFSDDTIDGVFPFLANKEDKMNKQYIEDFLKKSECYFSHIRIFSEGTKARLLSTLGAYVVECERITNEGKKIPLYQEADNTGTATFLAVGKLAHLGFTISGRRLYLKYKDINKSKNYERIKYYYRKLYSLGSLPYFLWENEDALYHKACTVDYDIIQMANAKFDRLDKN